VLTFAQYYRRSVTPERIRKGRALLKKYRPILDRVTRETGVPGRFLIAFWGMETNYGGFTGNTPIIRALATLAYEGRREKFFTRELIAALKIVQNNHFKLHQLKGSWAGAMGQVQFMPSNYLRYGRDGNGDGRVDLWNTLEDAFLSAGYFLAHLGWHGGETWGREVKLTRRFSRYELADGVRRRSLSEWAKLGVVRADGRPLPKKGPMAALWLPMGHTGPAFLLYPNFYVIKKWNHSYNYALSVGLLADAIVGRPLRAWLPQKPAGIPRARLRAIQQALKAQGYAIGKVDGIFGGRSRTALRKWQQEQGLPADGWPSETIWWKLHEQKQQAQSRTVADRH
uniref:lytic murein transglycosylase n=1 Tax=Sulfurivirga sp. TaxID=2614236 RepID=UPI0025E220CE